MLGDIEGFIFFIPFFYLAIFGGMYLVMRRRG